MTNEACAQCNKRLTVWDWLAHDSGPILCLACDGREREAKQAADAIAAAADAIAEAEACGYARGMAAERAAVVAYLRTRIGYGPLADAIEHGEHNP
jgi:hypothetical protein